MTAKVSINFVMTKANYSLCLFLRKAESDFCLFVSSVQELDLSPLRCLSVLFLVLFPIR